MVIVVGIVMAVVWWCSSTIETTAVDLLKIRSLGTKLILLFPHAAWTAVRRYGGAVVQWVYLYMVTTAAEAQP